jgi:hypothetical protein
LPPISSPAIWDATSRTSSALAAHVLVLHGGEHSSELLAHRDHGGLRAFQIPHALFDLGMELRVLRHLGVRVKDPRFLLAPRYPELVGRLRELVHNSLDGVLETL